MQSLVIGASWGDCHMFSWLKSKLLCTHLHSSVNHQFAIVGKSIGKHKCEFCSQHVQKHSWYYLHYPVCWLCKQWYVECHYNIMQWQVNVPPTTKTLVSAATWGDDDDRTATQAQNCNIQFYEIFAKICSNYDGNQYPLTCNNLGMRK